MIIGPAGWMALFDSCLFSMDPSFFIDFMSYTLHFDMCPF